jgi:hypothetical protein
MRDSQGGRDRDAQREGDRDRNGARDRDAQREGGRDRDGARDAQREGGRDSQKTGQDTQRGKDTQRTGQDTQRGDTKQKSTQSKSGTTSGSVNFTSEQKTKIRTTVLQSSSAPRVSRSELNVDIRVGVAVPRSRVKLVAVPSTIVEIHPAWRGYLYFIVDEEIIIVHPREYTIVAVIDV